MLRLKKPLTEIPSQMDGQTRLCGFIVSHMERINARNKNTINIVQCSKSLKTMIFRKFTKDNFHIFECHRSIAKSIDFCLFLLLWRSSWYQRVQSCKFKTLLWIPNHDLLSLTPKNIKFYSREFFPKTMAMCNCRYPPAFICQR